MRDDCSENSFEKKIEKIIEDYYDEFPEGRVYYKMREVFDEKIAEQSIKRSEGVKRASKRMGVAFKTFRKILRQRDK